MITIDDIGRAAATELRDAVLPELDSAAALARLDTPLQSTPDHRRRTPWRVVGLVAAAAAIIVAGVAVAVRHRDGRDKIINPVVTTTTTTAVGTTSSTEPTTTTTVAPTATALPVGRGSATVVPTPIPDTPLPRLVLPNPAMSPYQLQVGPCAACATTLFSAAKTVDPLEWTEVFLLPGHPLADGAIGIVTETKLGLLEQPGKVLDVSGHTYVTVQRAGLVAVVSGWNVARAELQRMADSLTGTGTDVGASVGYVPAGFVSAGAPTRPPSTLDGAWSVTYLGHAPDQPHQVTVGAFRTDRLETARSLVTTLGDGFSGGLVKKPYIVRGHDAGAVVGVSPPATISTIEWQEDDGVETYLDGSGNAESTMLGFAASLHPPTAEEWAARATSTCAGRSASPSTRRPAWPPRRSSCATTGLTPAQVGRWATRASSSATRTIRSSARRACRSAARHQVHRSAGSRRTPRFPSRSNGRPFPPAGWNPVLRWQQW